MKVVELLENDWENSSIPDTDVIRNIRQKETALNHHREIIVQKITQIIPTNKSTLSFEPWTSWQIGRTPLTEFPENIRKYVEGLKKIDALLANLAKRSVQLKINMKFANHDPELALRHAKYVRKGRYPEGEDAIASTPQTAYDYAVEVLKTRWPKGEPVIAKNKELRSFYKTRFGKIDYE